MARKREPTRGRVDVGRPQVLHVVGVAVPVYEARELLVLLLQPLRGDLRLLQQGLPLQLQERHVQVRVQDLDNGGGGDRERSQGKNAWIFPLSGENSYCCDSCSTRHFGDLLLLLGVFLGSLVRARHACSTLLRRRRMARFARRSDRPGLDRQ